MSATETRTYLYKYPRGAIRVPVDRGEYTELGAKLVMWRKSEREVRAALRASSGDEWEPVGELGPHNISIRTYPSYSPLDKGALFTIAAIVLLGLSIWPFHNFVWTVLALCCMGGFAWALRPRLVRRLLAEPAEFRAELQRIARPVYDREGAQPRIECHYCGRANPADAYLCAGCGAAITPVHK